MSTRMEIFMKTAKGVALAGVIASALCQAPQPARATPFGGIAADMVKPYRQEMSRLSQRVGELAEVERRVKALNEDLEWATLALTEVTAEIEAVIVDDDRIGPREQLKLVADVLRDGLGRMRKDAAVRNEAAKPERRATQAGFGWSAEGLSGMEAREADLVASIDNYSEENDSALQTVRLVAEKLDQVIRSAGLKDSDEIKAFDVLVEAMDLLPGGDGSSTETEAPLP